MAADLPALEIAGLERRDDIRFRHAKRFRGVSRADAKQATTLAAKTIPGGYEARNTVDGDLFVYRVSPRRLLVSKNGTQILSDAVTGTL